LGLVRVVGLGVHLHVRVLAWEGIDAVGRGWGPPLARLLQTVRRGYARRLLLRAIATQTTNARFT
jgi:hypothetical protein